MTKRHYLCENYYTFLSSSPLVKDSCFKIVTLLASSGVCEGSVSESCVRLALGEQEPPPMGQKANPTDQVTETS